MRGEVDDNVMSLHRPTYGDGIEQINRGGGHPAAGKLGEPSRRSANAGNGMPLLQEGRDNASAKDAGCANDEHAHR
jgi:hypothetical protein